MMGGGVVSIPMCVREDGCQRKKMVHMFKSTKNPCFFFVLTSLLFN